VADVILACGQLISQLRGLGHSATSSFVNNVILLMHAAHNFPAAPLPGDWQIRRYDQHDVG